MKYFRHGLTELLSEALLPGAILNSVKVINILKTPGYEQTFLRKPTMPYSIICKHTIARTAITQVQRRGPSRRLGGFLAVSVLGGPFFTTSQSAEACTQTHVWLAQIHSLVVEIRSRTRACREHIHQTVLDYLFLSAFIDYSG